MAAAMATRSGSLNRTDIVDAAERETGHYGIVDAGLLARLDRLIDYINERGPYTAARCEEMQRQVQQLLATRLRLAGDRRRLPAIAAEQIERPIFVIGFPRTGTTLLHSLLAEDPDSLAPRALHSHEPSPPPGEGLIAAQRTARTRRELERISEQAQISGRSCHGESVGERDLSRLIDHEIVKRAIELMTREEPRGAGYKLSPIACVENPGHLWLTRDELAFVDRLRIVSGRFLQAAEAQAGFARDLLDLV